ncbi:hypothetical protein MUK72_12850 [Halococcus dombrowskii]|uniref:Uncharacterized protein n=1 Tax=Halococcus dombrowskii TaxID=179637 RepID=A0AAX3AKY9_HALDO|nr:hypothetical protein [Halococcus dombrowskii]UOO94847.1 hypothetical protein MUK72_12850 [Halococcus dombrowskii]
MIKAWRSPSGGRGVARLRAAAPRPAGGAVRGRGWRFGSGAWWMKGEARERPEGASSERSERAPRASAEAVLCGVVYASGSSRTTVCSRPGPTPTA